MGTEYRTEEIKKRRIKLLSIITVAELQNIYRRINSPHSYMTAEMFRNVMFAEWENYQESIQLYFSLAWEKLS